MPVDIPLAREEQPKNNRKNKVKTRLVRRGLMEITIDEQHVGEFKSFVKRVLKSGLSLKYKLVVLDRRVGSFTYSVRHARSGFEEIVALSRWLYYRLEPLRTEADKKARKRPDPLYELAHRLPDIMVNKFKMLCDYRRYYRRASFFFDPCEHDELTFLRFFSPYREGGE